MQAAAVETLTTRMRDGISLAGDLYQPSGDAVRRPAILVRTPYGKEGYRDDALVRKAVERGYAVFVQDVRGRYASQGVFDPYRQDGRDGFDTVEWIAAQPWSNGRVGGRGLSYPGAAQWLTAVEAPPHLVCIFPAMCFSSGRQFFTFGGAWDMSWIPWTANNIAPDERRRRGLPGPKTGREARELWLREGQRALRHVPLNTLPLLQGVAGFYFEWLDHPDDGGFWDFADIESKHAQVRVPAFNFSGWHDEGYGPIGAARNFSGMRRHGATDAARQPRLVIGPWTHGEPTPASTKVGDVDFGAAAGLDYDALVLDWCDLHLRGIDRGLAAQPPVRVFVMGANTWRESREWPLPGTTPRALHLRAGGRLTWDAPAANEAGDAYVFDPNDPVEDPHYDAGLGPHDQRALERRADVLVFTSDPLPDDLEVIGHIETRLWIASSAPDTDFYARLLDVDEAGAAWNLMSPTLEVIRARYRHDEAAPEPLVPGQPYELVLRWGMTGNLFRRGHRIRLHVTSSFFPHLDRNPNTGRPVPNEGTLAPARQHVFHDASRPSRVILPVTGGA
ncbi:MAG: CocE/NonD family hydrolase [Acidobacteriota bacterium]